MKFIRTEIKAGSHFLCLHIQCSKFVQSNNIFMKRPNISDIVLQHILRIPIQFPDFPLADVISTESVPGSCQAGKTCQQQYQYGNQCIRKTLQQSYVWLLIYGYGSFCFFHRALAGAEVLLRIQPVGTFWVLGILFSEPLQQVVAEFLQCHLVFLKRM